MSLDGSFQAEDFPKVCSRFRPASAVANPQTQKTRVLVCGLLCVVPCRGRSSKLWRGQLGFKSDSVQSLWSGCQVPSPPLGVQESWWPRTLSHLACENLPYKQARPIKNSGVTVHHNNLSINYINAWYVMGSYCHTFFVSLFMLISFQGGWQIP